MKYIASNTLLLAILILMGFASCEKDFNYIEPLIDFEIQISDSIAPVNVSFHNKSVDLNQFEWDFGDGTISHEKSPNHFFNEDGIYTITLTASNDQEQLTVQKTIYLSKVYQYSIINNSQFKLYNLSTFSKDSSQNHVCINHGFLNDFQSSNKYQTSSENLYISFENDIGQKFITAFPFCLEDDILNELIINKYTLIIVDY